MTVAVESQPGQDDGDEALLASLEAKHRIIRDRVRGVATHYATGFYLWGAGGTSKSYTVEETLKGLNEPYVLTNSRVTGKGLITVLKDHPDLVHVLDDVETLFADQKAFGVLRSALWGQADASGRRERIVTWQTGNKREEVVFTGGIILIANRPLDDLPEIRAIGTRIAPLHHHVTNAEMAALMRQVAAKGYRHGDQVLTPDECLEVAAAVVVHSARIQRNLDMRLLINTFLDRLQWAAGAADTHWRDLLLSRMKERTIIVPGRRESRSQRKARESEFARSLEGLPREERVAAWVKETGLSQAAYYRARHTN
jgi:hypothetical protein